MAAKEEALSAREKAVALKEELGAARMELGAANDAVSLALAEAAAAKAEAAAAKEEAAALEERSSAHTLTPQFAGDSHHGLTRTESESELLARVRAATLPRPRSQTARDSNVSEAETAQDARPPPLSAMVAVAALVAALIAASMANVHDMAVVQVTS